MKMKVNSLSILPMLIAIFVIFSFLFFSPAHANTSKEPVFQTQIPFLENDETDVCFTEKDDSCIPIKTEIIDQALGVKGLQPLGISYIPDTSTVYPVSRLYLSTDDKNRTTITMLVKGSLFSNDSYLSFSGRSMFCTGEFNLGYDCFYVNSEKLLKHCLDYALTLKEEKKRKEDEKKRREKETREGYYGTPEQTPQFNPYVVNEPQR